MSLARARAARALQSTALRPVRSARPHQLPRLIAQAGRQRRWQSGGGHGGEHAAPSSDIPWIIGAVGVTVPGAWWLWPSPHSADAHGHGAEHHDEEEHAEEGESKEGGEEEEAPAEEEAAPAEQSEEKKGGDDSGKGEEKKDEGGDDKEEEKKPEGGDDSDSKEESSSDEKAGDSKNEEAEQPEGDDSKKATFASNPDGKAAPQFKGRMKQDAEGQSDSRKSEPMPASKGTMRKRIDSGYQKDLGSGEQYGDDSQAATAKQVGKATSGGDIASKQKGMSNTATRHSTQIEDDPDKSKKAEGTPETAKSMGTVDPSRPAK